jgi:hypothetical protein
MNDLHRLYHILLALCLFSFCINAQKANSSSPSWDDSVFTPLENVLRLGVGLIDSGEARGVMPRPRFLTGFIVHGRLSITNGTPSFRIWIIGTTHILGIDQIDDNNPIMPDTLKKLIRLDNKIYADFTAKPLSKYKRGEIQRVQVLSVRNIIVRQ